MFLKRVLFAGPLWRGSTCIPRLKGLQCLGLGVNAIDTTAWEEGGGKLWRPFIRRFYFGPSVRAMNEALMRDCGRFSPDAVWIEKGRWIYPATLKKMRKVTQFMIHYNTDDVFANGSYFWLHRFGIKQYDLYLTTNRWNVQEIQRRYGVRTLRVGMGYDGDFHKGESLNCCPVTRPVIFIGHWQPHTEKFISSLQRAGVEIQVWGNNWRKAKNHALRSSKPLPYDDYVPTVAGAKIALCFISRRNRNESTGRSFEIPAIGTFMMAERTAEHEFLYGDPVGAALFSNEKELVDKVLHYLYNAEERQNIANVGYTRCKTLGLSWADHLRRELPIVERWLQEGNQKLLAGDDDPFWAGFREGKAFSGKSARCPGKVV